MEERRRKIERVSLKPPLMEGIKGKQQDVAVQANDRMASES